MPTPDEIERTRAAVSVACLRWLRPEPVAVGFPRESPARRADVPFRLLDLPDDTVPRDRDHPLWDRWLDG